MNVLEGYIEEIISSEGISLVTIDTREGKLSTLVFDTPENNNYLKVGNKIKLLFKETEVATAKGEVSNISHQNILEGIVEDVSLGKVVVYLKIKLKTTSIGSIITRKSFDRLSIKIGDRIKAIIKSTEISLEKV